MTNYKSLKEKIETTKNDICNLENCLENGSYLEEYDYGDKRKTELEDEYINELYKKKDYLEKLNKKNERIIKHD